MPTPSPTEAAWPTEWLRGALAVCVLHVVAGGPTYGYAIASALADAGLGTVKGGTLYPLLGRFEEAGLVSVEWRAGDGGPGRKFYALTPAGEEEHRRQVTHWLAFADVTSSFVHSPALAQPSRKDPS
jgi:PadR family transcriptional regulator, regulatory protein PadR